MEFTVFQAAITGLIQGITELFPVSSLGHAVLVPAWIGGSWSNFTTDPNSPYLAVTIALHLASAAALFVVFRKRWMKILVGAVDSARGRRSDAGQVFWRIFVATIPVGILGLVFEKPLRELFSKPLASAIFLTTNGLLLITAERLSRQTSATQSNEGSDRQIVEHLSFLAAISIGFSQSLALFSGISRFGISMSAGMLRRLSHATASDFAFLLALPVIAGAAVLKVPDLFAAQYKDLVPAILLGSFISFLATYASVTFLVRWFKTRTLYPFAIYCIIIGFASIIRFA